jgi:hypothetical protein
VLKDAEGPLDAREIVELTGLKYESLRLMLNRMCMAGDIVRPYRGKFTTLNHPSIARQSAIISDDTNNTSDTNDTDTAGEFGLGDGG